MIEQRSELRIPLPRDPVLRVLAYYGIGALIILTTVRLVVSALALPEWVGTLIVAAVVLGAPLATLGAWIAHRRR